MSEDEKALRVKALRNPFVEGGYIVTGIADDDVSKDTVIIKSGRGLQHRGINYGRTVRVRVGEEENLKNYIDNAISKVITDQERYLSDIYEKLEFLNMNQELNEKDSGVEEPKDFIDDIVDIRKSYEAANTDMRILNERMKSFLTKRNLPIPR